MKWVELFPNPACKDGNLFITDMQENLVWWVRKQRDSAGMSKRRWKCPLFIVSPSGKHRADPVSCIFETRHFSSLTLNFLTHIPGGVNSCLRGWWGPSLVRRQHRAWPPALRSPNTHSLSLSVCSQQGSPDDSSPRVMRNRVCMTIVITEGRFYVRQLIELRKHKVVSDV